MKTMKKIVCALMTLVLLAKVALHGIQNKVVQRLTDNGEEIQIQLHRHSCYGWI